MTHYDNIDNLKLLDNNLEHILFEIERENTSFFRIARESHQSLYRAMVQALKGSANLAITGKSSKTRSVKYKFGDSPFMEIHKIEINNCEEAWRYSKPKQCEEPKINESNSFNIEREDFLKSFYDLLAMMQTECYMHQYVISKSVKVSDYKMRLLERLHEDIRNKYEHFIPTSYYVSILGLASVSKICIDLAFELVFESKNIMIGIPDNMRVNMENIILKLQNIIKKEENLMLNNLLYSLPIIALSTEYIDYF